MTLPRWHDRLPLSLAVVGGLAGGGAAYALVRRDLGSLRALAVAAVTSFAVALGWLFALYGAVVGVPVAVLVYAVARSRIGAGNALIAAGGSYLVVVAGVGALIYASLDTM
jgi:hypothetical protein